MCFDRSAIVDTLMAGQGRETSTWFRPGSPEAQNAPKPLPFDPPAARRVLADAGVGNGHKLELTVIIAAGQSIHRRILELAQQTVRELPIKLDIVAMQWSAMSARLKQRDFDAMLVFFSLDPVEDPFPNFHSTQSESGLNYTGYNSPRADRVLEQARRTSDAAERLALCARFNEIFHEDQPVTLLAYPLTGVLLHKRFQDADPNKLGLYPERWWVKPRNK
jgi:peptide/nickel transport system substrate-binding protein